MAKTVISIEIGAARIRMAELVMGKTHQAVKKADIFDTPDGTMEDGFIRDGASIASALSSHILTSGMTAKEIVFAISSTKVVSREVTVQAAKEKLLKSVVEAEASDYFPMDLADYVITYSVIGRKPAEKSFRLMVYAVPSALLQSYYDLAAELNKGVAAIDVEGNALFQWFNRSTLSDVSLVVEVNSSTSLLTVVDHKEMGVQRSIGYGAVMFANVLSDANAYDEIKTQNDAYKLMQEQAFFGIGDSDDAFWRENEMTRIRAQRFKKLESEIKTEDTLDDLDGNKEEKEEEQSVTAGLTVNEILERRQAARNELAETARQLISNIRRVLDYYATKNPESQVQKIYIAGLGASLMGLTSMIASELQLPTETLDVTEGVVFVKQAAEVESRGAEFLSCFGAVLRPLGLRSQQAMAKAQTKLVTIVSLSVGFLAAAALLGIALVTKLQIASIEKENEQLAIDIANLEEIEELQRIYLASQEAVTFADGLEDLIFTPSQQIESILTSFEMCFPARSVVSSISVNDEQMMVNVATVTKEEAAKLIMALRELPYFEAVGVDGITDEIDEQTDRHVVSFTVNLLLKNWNDEPVDGEDNSKDVTNEATEKEAK